MIPAPPMRTQAIETLKKMADFLRDLLEAARRHNGPRPHWENEREAEIDALEAGVSALALLTPSPSQEGSIDLTKAEYWCWSCGVVLGEPPHVAHKGHTISGIDPRLIAVVRKSVIAHYPAQLVLQDVLTEPRLSCKTCAHFDSPENGSRLAHGFCQRLMFAPPAPSRSNTTGLLEPFYCALYSKVVCVSAPPVRDAEWIREAEKTLDHLAAALQRLDVPYRVEWRQWIDQLVAKFSAPVALLARTAAEKATIRAAHRAACDCISPEHHQTGHAPCLISQLLALLKNDQGAAGLISPIASPFDDDSLFAFVVDYQERHRRGFYPTVSEVSAHFGVSHADVLKAVDLFDSSESRGIDLTTTYPSGREIPDDHPGNYKVEAWDDGPHGD